MPMIRGGVSNPNGVITRLKGKMMKKTIGKVICFTLCACFIGASAACSNGGVNTDGWINESGEEPITLTWYVDLPTFTKRFGDTLTDREIFRHTGVKIEFSNADSVTGSSKLSTMAMSNQLTDLVSFQCDTELANQLVTGNFIWSMNDLFGKYDDVENFLPEDMYKWCTYDDGKLYGLRTHFFGEDIPDDQFPTNNVMVASVELLEKYNLDPQEDFSSMEKLFESCMKVKNGENNPAFIPFFTYTGGQDLAEYLAIPKETMDGDYQDWLETEEAMDLAVWMNKFYRNGLISEASLTASKSVGEVIASQSVFVVCMNYAENQYKLWDAYLDNGEQYVAIGPVRNENGDDPMLSPWTPNGYLDTCISKNCKDPRRALKLLEFLYSQEGQVLANFGIENDSYTIEDGKYYFTNKYYTMDEDEIADYYGNTWYEALVSNTPYLRSIEGIPKQDPARFTREILDYFSQWSFNSRAFNKIHPTDTRTGLVTTMNSANQLFNWVEIITSQKQGTGDDVAKENILQLYKKQINARNGYKGYDEVKAYYNKQFKANKEKLGKEYIWPSVIEAHK